LAVPATVVYFVTYENLRLLIKDRHNGIQPYWGPLIAGATARVWSVTLVSPLELIRTKMQSKKVSYQGKPLRCGIYRYHSHSIESLPEEYLKLRG
jgi:solute carrier family 25 protein 39/40